MNQLLELLGWICLLIVGGYITLASAGMAIVERGFCGRIGVHTIVAFLGGLAVLGVAMAVSPIHIAWGHA